MKMMNPSDNIVPLLAVEGANVRHFLGTAFFVVKSNLLLTADHCIKDWNGGFAITTRAKLPKLFEAVVVKRDTPHDLALLRVDGYAAPNPLQIAQDFGHNNLLVSNFEYGTTQLAGKHLEFSPATRIGNVTRCLKVDFLGAAGEDALELSFPALRGASGSPVLNRGFEVIGLMVANASYHLLPAQIESVIDEKNKVKEEIKYMLPQGLAVNCKFIKAFVDGYLSTAGNSACA